MVDFSSGWRAWRVNSFSIQWKSYSNVYVLDLKAFLNPQFIISGMSYWKSRPNRNIYDWLDMIIIKLFKGKGCTKFPRYTLIISLWWIIFCVAFITVSSLYILEMKTFLQLTLIICKLVEQKLVLCTIIVKRCYDVILDLHLSKHFVLIH